MIASIKYHLLSFSGIMKAGLFVSVLILVCAAVAFSGCTGNPNTQPVAGPVSTGSGASASGSSLIPGPTDVMPENIAVLVNVGEKDYLGKIPVIFQGGQGQINAKRIDVKLTRTDGTTQIATLGTNKGDEIDLDGTKGSGTLTGQTDRVEVWVSMNNGQTYKIADVNRDYRTR